MKYLKILVIIALIYSCGSGNKQQSSDTSAEKKPSKASVVHRLEAIYSVIFDEYRNAEHVNWPFSSFFDDELKSLWKTIPNDGPGIGFDPWTCSQDYDKNALKLLNVKVGDITGDDTNGYLTEAVVTIKLAEVGEPNKIRIILSTNKKGNENNEWYINDFFDVNFPEYKGVVNHIKEEFSNSVSDDEMLDIMQKAVNEEMKRRGN